MTDLFILKGRMVQYSERSWGLNEYNYLTVKLDQDTDFAGLENNDFNLHEDQDDDTVDTNIIIPTKFESKFDLTIANLNEYKGQFVCKKNEYGMIYMVSFSISYLF